MPETTETIAWIWNLHGELIDHALEKMETDPTDSDSAYDNYIAATRLADKYYRIRYGVG